MVSLQPIVIPSFLNSDKDKEVSFNFRKGREACKNTYTRRFKIQTSDMGHTPPLSLTGPLLIDLKVRTAQFGATNFYKNGRVVLFFWSVRESSSWNTFIRVFLHHGWRLAWLQCWIRDKLFFFWRLWCIVCSFPLFNFFCYRCFLVSLSDCKECMHSLKYE